MLSKKVILNALCEFGPIISFLVADKLSNFQQATVVMIITTIISILILYTFERHVPYYAIISALSVIVFGVLSLVISNPTYFILRDSIYDAVLGGILLITGIYGKPFLKTLFDHVFAITEKGWLIFNRRWALMFLALAFANEIVRQTVSAEGWVLAKVIFIIASTAFGTYQFTLTRREHLPEASSWGTWR